MKKAALIILFVISTGLFAQTVQTDSLGFQTFTYPEGDTVYTMKQYFMVFLKSGPTRSQTPEEAAEIQKNHLAHIGWMAEQGYVDIAGPFGDDGDVRGILVMRVPTKERAEELAAMDPAVKAGRLIMEIHPWWAAVGSTLK
tara:strand:- start:471 stop:893 length:423 start_codon:yes stop_codon:yes gene_type:complete